jgi:hypothetical protein
MNWNKRSTKNAHALLSPSKPYWLNYDEDKLDRYYETHRLAALGTRLHKVAEECISLGIRLAQNTATLNQFVNDAIGYRMDPEVLLWFSDNAFGTADAISFDGKLLRIHDLKTGTAPGKTAQVDIYAALFFLEYGFDPEYTEMELRIYQNDEVLVWSPAGQEINTIMETIKRFDTIIEMKKKVE